MKKSIFRTVLCWFLVLSMIIPSSLATAFAAEEEVQTTIYHTQTEGDSNYFTYSESGWSAMGNSSEHVWSDTPSATNPESIWYEVKFVGHKIDVYAGKNRPMGMVDYYIDGEKVGTYSLYNGSNINSTYIATFGDLEEKEHTFRAVATGKKDTNSTNSLIDCAEVIVYHAPYAADSITLEKDKVVVPMGATREIVYSVTPSYAELSDVTYTSSNTNVATVSEDGVITAVAKGDAVITIASAVSNLSVTLEVSVTEAVAGISGSIVDTDTQWTQDRYNEVSGMDTMSAELTAWKNDKAVSELALISVDSALKNVTVTASDLVSEDGAVISNDNVTTTFIKSTKAYNGSFLGYGNPDRAVPADNGTNRSESSDILYQTTPIDIAYNNVQPVWVEFAIPADAQAGTYTGTISVTADDVEDALEFSYTVVVYNALLPDAEDYTFDIMQWQYPYSSAEYYGVEAFSEEHFAILESNMGIYKEVGGNAITTTFTEEAWSGQTYSANSIHYPSMVKWTKNSDGSFSYDYSDFDAWVSFCKEMGLGDKIVAYGIAPWHGSFTYWTEGASAYTKEAYTVGNTRYVQVWTAFLTDFANHLKEKGWMKNVYIGIDERGVNSSAFDVAEAAGFKTAADIDNITNHWAIAQRVTDLNVGDTAAQNYSAKFAELLAIREAKGYTTTLYSCTEHQPGQFSLSAPVESYWAVLNAGMMGADGFNRWAYDAWVANPLEDTTHNAFEPGDCFVIFPDEKDAQNPEAKYSVRLARMAEGVRDVNKLRTIAEEEPSLASAVANVFAIIDYKLKTTNSSYMSDAAVAELAAETADFKDALNEITESYVFLQSGESIVIDDAKKVAYYSFDNVADGTLVNEWAEDRNGTIADSATVEDGKQGKALSVNAAGEGAVITDSSDLDGSDWTVGYWVKTTSDFDKEISVLEDAAQANSLSLRLSDSRDKGGFRTGDGSGDVLTYNYTFEKDTWYHITWVQDKDGSGLSLYVNGQLVQTNAWTVSNSIAAPIEVIGGTGFTGLIDEVKIYNAVLTDAEIAASMQVEGINLEEASAEIYLGNTYKIRATLISNNVDRSLTYTSANTSIATVDKKGVVTGVGRGTTTITVKNEATGYEAEFKVKVSVEISILNLLNKYELPESYQSDVEGPYPDDADMRYLGQPDMVQTETGRLITVFPVGHGHGRLIMKYSEDQGETWTTMTNTPESWEDSQETPTIYSLKIDDGNGGLKERLMLICACPNWDLQLGGWQYSYSDDNGETWTEFEHVYGNFEDGSKNYTIVAMASLIQLKDENGNYIQKWMGVYHNDSFINYKTYLTFDENGEAQWTYPVPYLSEYRTIESSHQICEVGMFRSPDGERIVALARNQTHTGPATMFYSDDEGETWSEPVELPGSLAGERHKALYDPISGKLVITFREIDYDRDNDGVWEGGTDWTAGEWVAWVGTYEDLMNLQQGDYMLILDEDFAQNYYSGDTGYTGMAVLEDGTFILHSYGHWDEEFSKNYRENGSYNVKTDLCWIRQAKFTLAEVEEELGIVSGTVTPSPTPTPDPENIIPVSEMTATAGDEETEHSDTSVEGPASLAIDENESTIWHTNWYVGPNYDNHWLQLELNDVYKVDSFRYLPRQNGNTNGIITSYKILVSMDGENWTEVAEGTWDSADRTWKTASFDAVNAKYVCLKVEASESDIGIALSSAAEVRLTGTKVECDEHTVELVGVKAATCTEDGFTGNEACTKCGLVITAGEVIPATGHKLGEAVVTEATCTEDGSSVKTCEVCGEEVTEVIPATGHDWSDWEVTKEATETEAGLKERVCANCGETEEEEIPALGGEVKNPFKDVFENDWYYKAVLWGTENKVVAGLSDNLFGPAISCTRAQIVAFLWRAAGRPEVENTECTFEDVDSSDYYYKAMLWATQNEIVKGYDEKTFGPNDTCTRAQMAAFLWRAAGRPELVPGEVVFTDISASEYYYVPAVWAQQNGIISGYGDGTQFAPNGTITRAETVTMLYRYYR